VSWTTTDLVAAALGNPTLATDPYLSGCVDASNAWCYRKRMAAGYDDDPDVSPGPDVTMGATQYAVGLWRERASTDGYPSFTDLGAYGPTGGSMGQIRRLLGIGRGRVDADPDDTALAARRRHPAGWPR